MLNHLSSTTFDPKKWTNADPILPHVRKFYLQGWPQATLGTDFKPYLTRKVELTIFNVGLTILNVGFLCNCPSARLSQVLNRLHESHKMKIVPETVACYTPHVRGRAYSKRLENFLRSSLMFRRRGF